MTDRELLELAAKAAGNPIFRWIGSVPQLHDGKLWEPLVDDGDALRLAVKLRITVEQDLLETKCAAYVVIGNKRAHYVSISGKVTREEATRRSIVRAAAEIGKEMK